MNKITHSCQLAVAVSVLLFSVSAARAQGIGSPTIFQGVEFYQGSNSGVNYTMGPTTTGETIANFGPDSGSYDIVLGADPGVTASAAVSAGFATSNVAQLSATIVYGFEVLGPAGQSVPVDISAIGFTSFAVSNPATATGFGSADLSLGLLDPSGTFLDTDLISETADVNPAGSYPDNFALDDQVVDLETDTLYGVDISALADAQTNLDATATATMSASVDPTIVIDPTFLSDNPEYSLEFAPGVGAPAGAGVPDATSTLPLLLACVAFLFVFRGLPRTKRRASGLSAFCARA